MLFILILSKSYEVLLIEEIKFKEVTYVPQNTVFLPHHCFANLPDSKNHLIFSSQKWIPRPHLRTMDSKSPGVIMPYIAKSES